MVQRWRWVHSPRASLSLRWEVALPLMMARGRVRALLNLLRLLLLPVLGRLLPLQIQAMQPLVVLLVLLQRQPLLL